MYMIFTDLFIYTYVFFGIHIYVFIWLFKPLNMPKQPQNKQHVENGWNNT